MGVLDSIWRPVEPPKQTVDFMVEFTSQDRPRPRLMVLFLAAGVVVVAATLLVVVVRHQKNRVAVVPAAPIVIEGMVHPGDSNFEYYKTKVRIENVRASLSITFGKQRVATISGIIYNDGDRKLDALEMRITLYDLYGALSKEKTAIPLRPGLGIGYKPMEPLEKRPFAINVESIEQLWNPKHVEYEVTGLKFH
jgi:hypothetical protein